MPDPNAYKQFVSQFNLSEWKLLCKHRLFLHFLKIDLKKAACIAAEALGRPVHYVFPTIRKTGNSKSSKSTTPRIRLGGAHRRFRL